jgi:hypothetical protein
MMSICYVLNDAVACTPHAKWARGGINRACHPPRQDLAVPPPSRSTWRSSPFGYWTKFAFVTEVLDTDAVPAASGSRGTSDREAWTKLRTRFDIAVVVGRANLRRCRSCSADEAQSTSRGGNHVESSDCIPSVLMAAELQPGRDDCRPINNFLTSIPIARGSS